MSKNDSRDESPTELDDVFGFLDANLHVESSVEVRAVAGEECVKMAVGDQVKFWVILDHEQSQELVNQLEAAISKFEAAEPAE